MGWLAKLITYLVLPSETLIQHDEIYSSEFDILSQDWCTVKDILQELKTRIYLAFIDYYPKLIFKEETHEKKLEIIEILQKLIEEEAAIAKEEEAAIAKNEKQQGTHLNKIKNLERKLKKHIRKDAIEDDESEDTQTEESGTIAQQLEVSERDDIKSMREYIARINNPQNQNNQTDKSDEIETEKKFFEVSGETSCKEEKKFCQKSIQTFCKEIEDWFIKTANDIYQEKCKKETKSELSLDEPGILSYLQEFLMNYLNSKTAYILWSTRRGFIGVDFPEHLHNVLNELISKFLLYSKKIYPVVFDNRCKKRALYYTDKINVSGAPNLIAFPGNSYSALYHCHNFVPDQAKRKYASEEYDDSASKTGINAFVMTYRRKLKNKQNSRKKEEPKDAYVPHFNIKRIASDKIEAISGQNNEFIKNADQKLNNDINNNQELLTDKNLEQKLNDSSIKADNFEDTHAKSMQELLKDCYVATKQIIEEQPNKNFTFQMISLGVSLGTHTILKLIHEQVIEKNNLPKIILINGMKNPAIVAASQVANYTTAPLIAIFSTPLIYFSITTVNPIFLACIGLLALMIGYIVTKKIIYSLKTKEDVRKYYTNKNSTKPEPQQYSKFRGDKISTLFAKGLEPIFRYVFKKVDWYIDTQSDFNQLINIYKENNQIAKIMFTEGFHDKIFVAGSQLEFTNTQLKFGDKFYDDKGEYNQTDNYYVVNGHNNIPDYLAYYTYKKMYEINQNNAQKCENLPTKLIPNSESIISNFIPKQNANTFNNNNNIKPIPKKEGNEDLHF